MKVHGSASVSQFLTDNIVYRNLEPMDKRLPTLDAVRPALGLPAGHTPRKSQLDYARVIVHLLRQARALDLPSVSLERLIFVGDTHLNDGNAFRNISQVGSWSGLAFIGADRAEPARLQENRDGERALYLANRWSMLLDLNWDADQRTAVVIDLDKTALGARGRNDHVIDGARVAAVRETVGSLLGDDFNPGAFRNAYDMLNQLEFHPFTADNQDYLAYICLMLGSGLVELDALVDRVRAGQMSGFDQFIAEIDARVGELPTGLAALHRDVFGRVRLGDPTPFKAFRYNEYRATVARMGALDDAASVEKMLAQEIVITQEVMAMALKWREQGALLFGLSDKPDEASVPTADLAAQGLRPLHQVGTHVVGG